VTVFEHAWPAGKLGDALSELVRRSGMGNPGAHGHVGNPPPGAPPVTEWIERATAWLGAEAEPTDTPYSRLSEALSGMAPAVVRLDRDGETRFVLLVRRRGRRLIVLAADLREHAISVADLRHALVEPLEKAAGPAVDRLLTLSTRSARAQQRAREWLMAERLAGTKITGLWIVRPSAVAPFWHLFRRSVIPRLAATIFVAHSAHYAAIVAGWFLIARTLGQEQAAVGWLIGWALLMASAIPLRLLSNWASAQLGLELGTLLRRRMLIGTLYLAPDETRRRGVGNLLARVVEGEIVEALGLQGVVLAITAFVELVLAVAIMSAGAAPVAHSLLAIGSVAVLVSIWPRYFRAWQDASEQRLVMSDGAIEGIIGHQTRLAQQPPEQWHEREDQVLREYLHTNERADRLATLSAMVPRGWLIVAVLALMPAFGTSNLPVAKLALSLGGMLLAYRTLMRAVAMFSSLISVVSAWQKTEPLLRDIPQQLGAVDVPSVEGRPAAEPGTVIAMADNLSYCYPGTKRSILGGCSATIHAGDRILLQGGSGSGKSTLCAMLAGVRDPDSGLLLVDGLDRRTLGQHEWRRRVVSAPQFHDNHIFSASLAFNLLLGRRWPPTREDLDAATKVCQELGLGELLTRMPGGLQQMVGDMGWQLSHGEKSRVFVARTLLQDASLVILDESFAALDPETLALCAKSVLARAPSLILVAHP
jgi:ATP-binding cassette subfamily B protein